MDALEAKQRPMAQEELVPFAAKIVKAWCDKADEYNHWGALGWDEMAELCIRAVEAHHKIGFKT